VERAGTGHLKSFRVLIVDGDAVAREATCAVLSRDFDVKACTSAREALKILQRDVFHVVCSDWRMPDMDGLEFFQLMSRQPMVPTACILLTAHAEEVAATPFPDRKTFGVIRKPCPPGRLIEQVRHYANMAEMRRTIRDLNIAAHREKKASEH
jgi:DNA-binding NtrC family response regulator